MSRQHPAVVLHYVDSVGLGAVTSWCFSNIRVIVWLQIIIIVMPEGALEYNTCKKYRTVVLAWFKKWRSKCMSFRNRQNNKLIHSPEGHLRTLNKCMMFVFQSLAGTIDIVFQICVSELHEGMKCSCCG